MGIAPLASTLLYQLTRTGAVIFSRSVEREAIGRAIAHLDGPYFIYGGQGVLQLLKIANKTVTAFKRDNQGTIRSLTPDGAFVFGIKGDDTFHQYAIHGEQYLDQQSTLAGLGTNDFAVAAAGDGTFWISDDADDRLRHARWNPRAGVLTLLEEFPSPYGNIRGMCVDKPSNHDLWVVDAATSKAYLISVPTMAQKQEVKLPSGAPYGIATDGVFLYLIVTISAVEPVPTEDPAIQQEEITHESA